MTLSKNNSGSYKAIIIGSGQSGNPLAVALAKANWKTAVIERQYVGGTCINCQPSWAEVFALSKSLGITAFTTVWIEVSACVPS